MKTPLEIKNLIKELESLDVLSHEEAQAKLALVQNKLSEDKNFDKTKYVEKQSFDTPEMSLDKPVVTIENFTKHYKGRANAAVDNISFNIYPGQFHAFIGANGAGKTTTIKSIIGAYSKYTMKGKILIKGMDNNSVKAKQEIGYIPENAVFPKKMTAIDYLVLMAMLAGYKLKDAKNLSKDLLEKLNMSNFASKYPYSFSSGQKKKMLLAQALIRNPSILIMDEPAANLDPLARDDLFNTLLTLQKEGKAIFLSSHILDEIGKFATYTTILDGGKVVYDGKLDANTDLSELYRSHVKLGSVDN